MYLFLIFLMGVLARYTRMFYRLTVWRKALSHIPQLPLDNIWKGHKMTLEKVKHDNTYLDEHIRWVNEYGQSMVFWIVSQPILFTADPVILHEIASDLTKYRKSHFLPNRHYFGEPLVGTDSVLSGNGVDWAKKRKVMAGYFSKRNMVNLFEHMNNVIEGVEMTRIENDIGNNPRGKIMDLHDTVAVTLYSCLNTLGVSDIMDPVEMAATAKHIIGAIPKSFFANEVARLAFVLGKEKKDTTELIKTLRNKILEKLKEVVPANQEGTGDNVLEGLVYATKTQFGLFNGQCPTKMAERLVNDTVATILVFDNMVKQLAVLYILLENRPDIQEKMVKELRETEVNSYGDLDKLKYTEYCILECMRMRPSLLRGSRDFKDHVKLKKDSTFGHYKIPKELGVGIKIHFSEYVQQMNPKVWDNPTEFKPERWSNGFSPDKYNYMPFWVGQRSCLGRHLGMMLMKTIMYHMNRNFDVTQAWSEASAPVWLQSMATIRLTGDVPCRFTKRVAQQ